MNNSPEVISKFDAMSRPFHFGQSPGRDVLVVCAAILVLAAVLFGWAAFMRKRPRRSKSSWRPPHSSTDSHHGHRRRHKHHRHHHEDHMNPTLAETGGLPNARPRRNEPSGGHPGNTPAS